MKGINAVGSYGKLAGVLLDTVETNSVMTTELATECGPSSGAL
jgi:hypothetical protein